jgi:PhoH-like ATPase
MYYLFRGEIMAKIKKLFILDTNVLLHDYLCIYNFENNDVVIPIVALEELDNFKRGHDNLNYQAREFTRQLNNISEDSYDLKGIPLGKGLGKLFIETGKPFSETLNESFPERTPDHKILAIAEYLKNKNPGRPVILVTKDINLRVKARSLQIKAQDYTTDKIQDLDAIYRPVTNKSGLPSELINNLYSSAEGLPVDSFKFDRTPVPNEYFILKNGQSSALGYHNSQSGFIERVVKKTCYGIDPRNAEQTFALDALTRDNIQLVAMTGKAGTGKTLLALAGALAQRSEFKQIFLARPIVPLSNKDIGFLPGDVQEKISPYMQPLFDNLSVIKNRFPADSKEYRKIEQMLNDEKLVITPLTYIRGRSLSNIFFIVDEAQNLTPHEIKTIITRAGEGSKLVFCGDIEQIDTPYLD